MDVYYYHPETGEFLGSSFAETDPLDQSHILVPAFATLMEPPEEQEGHVRVFKVEEWSQAVDHRKETWWNGEGEPVVIDFLGDPAERGLLDNKPEIEPEPPTVNDVATERDRRLALGFDFDFGGVRGVHRIGTSSDDMRKWIDEVTPLAQTYINAGQPSGEITITTETGVAVITADEWQLILIAAAGYRQPLYAASFALQAMDPIPADFAANPAYWP